VDHAERGHSADVGQLALIGGRDPVSGARPSRRDVDLAAGRAALAEQPAVREPAQETALPGRGRVLVVQPHRRGDHGHGLYFFSPPGPRPPPRSPFTAPPSLVARPSLLSPGGTAPLRLGDLARLEALDVVDVACGAQGPPCPPPHPGPP